MKLVQSFYLHRRRRLKNANFSHIKGFQILFVVTFAKVMETYIGNGDGGYLKKNFIKIFDPEKEWKKELFIKHISPFFLSSHQFYLIS